MHNTRINRTAFTGNAYQTTQSTLNYFKSIEKSHFFQEILEFCNGTTINSTHFFSKAFTHSHTLSHTIRSQLFLLWQHNEVGYAICVCFVIGCLRCVCFVPILGAVRMCMVWLAVVFGIYRWNYMDSH